MLQSDEIIFNILKTAKEDGNELLHYFKLGYPSRLIAKDVNSIFVASVDSESYQEGTDYSQYRDMVEIVVVTKKRDYLESLDVIKTVCREIVKLIYENVDKFHNKPVVRNITPDYGTDYVVNRGHIMVQVTTEPFRFDNNEADINRVCQILVNDIEEE